MEPIRCYGCGVATTHPLKSFFRNYRGQEYWLLMCFNTDFVYYRNGKMHKGNKYQCLLHSPRFPIIHGPGEINTGFENDWIFFGSDDVGKLIQELELPLNESFSVEKFNCLTSYISSILQEETLPMYYSAQYISGIIQNMLIHVARKRRVSSFQDSAVYASVKRVRRDMLENCEAQYTLQALAEAAGYSVSRFSELYRQFYGCSPIDELIQMRMKKAKQYLLFSNKSISEIAALCGFDSIHYFSSASKKHEGCAPSKYRSLTTEES